MPKRILPLCLILFTSLYSSDSGSISSDTLVVSTGTTNSEVPAEPSFLYDASPLNFGEQPIQFDVITPQLLLSAGIQQAPKEKENFALYAYRFFFKKGSAVSAKDVFISHDIFKNGGFDKETMTEGGLDDKPVPNDNFNVNLHLLEEHCDPENKELCNLLQCMLLEDTQPSTRKSSVQHFCHSEQRILIHVRSSLKKELAKMSRDGELKDLCAVALHIYSAKDPCYNCGSSIQYVIQTILREAIKKFIQKIPICAATILKLEESKKPTHETIVTPSLHTSFPDNFSVFAVVSSSKTYGTPFDSWRRGADVESESALNYFCTHSSKKGVQKGPLNIVTIDGKSFYFWVPSLENIELTSIPLEGNSTGFSVTVKKNESGFGNFYQLINVVKSPSCLTEITTLKFESGIKFSISDDLTVIDPRRIGELTQLRSLDISGTNARSAYLCDMFTTPESLLVSLNLNGAIVHYRDADSSAGKPERTALFKALGELPALTQLDAENNNINIDEFCIWLNTPSKMLKKIEHLNLANNRIFDIKEDAVDEVKSLVENFVKERSKLKIDLRENGTISDRWRDIECVQVGELSQNASQQQQTQQVTQAAGAALSGTFNTPFGMTNKEVALFCKSRNQEENKKIGEVVNKKWERKSAKYKEVEKWAEEYKKILTK